MENLAVIFKALSNINRLVIFHELLHREGLHLGLGGETCCGQHAKGNCCIGELGKKVQLAPSTISHHIKELKNAGLIDISREGNFLYCSVNTGNWGKVLSFFRHCDLAQVNSHQHEKEEDHKA